MIHSFLQKMFNEFLFYDSATSYWHALMIKTQKILQYVIKMQLIIQKIDQQTQTWCLMLCSDQNSKEN